MADFPPNPPTLNGVETGWLDSRLTGLGERCLRQGAIAALAAHGRVPTVAEAREGAERSWLMCEPDWDAFVEATLPIPTSSFLAVCLKTDQALDDDPEKLYAALETYWQQREGRPRTRLAEATAVTDFASSLSTPTLLVLVAVVNKLWGPLFM